jgi:hypothetical protein
LEFDEEVEFGGGNFGLIDEGEDGQAHETVGLASVLPEGEGIVGVNVRVPGLQEVVVPAVEGDRFFVMALVKEFEESAKGFLC